MHHAALVLLFLFLPCTLAAEGLDQQLIREGVEAENQGDIDTARERYLHAQQYLHREEGVWTLSQIDLIDRLTRIALANNDQQQADKQQSHRFRIIEHNFNDSHPEFVGALVGLAAYRDVTLRYSEARRLYRTATAIHHEHLFNPATVKLLSNQYLRGVCCRQSDIDKATASIQAAGNLDSAEKAELLIRVADIGIFAGRAEYSQVMYSEATQLSSPVEQSLSQPTLLGVSRVDQMTRAYTRAIERSRKLRKHRLRVDQYVPPGSLVGSPLPICEARMQDLVGTLDVQDYQIKLTLEVMPSGKTSNIQIVSSNAPVALNNLMRKLYRIARFRPGLGSDNAQEIELVQTFGSATEIDPVDRFPYSDISAAHGCFALGLLHDRDSVPSMAGLR